MGRRKERGRQHRESQRSPQSAARSQGGRSNDGVHTAQVRHEVAIQHRQSPREGRNGRAEEDRQSAVLSFEESSSEVDRPEEHMGTFPIISRIAEVKKKVGKEQAN